MKPRVLSLCLTVLTLAAPLCEAGAQASAATPPPVLSDRSAARLHAAAEPFVSCWQLELARLLEAGVAEEIILPYIEQTPGTYNLAPDQLIALRDLGASSEILAAALRHDAEIAAGLFIVPASTVPLQTPPFRLPLIPEPALEQPAAPVPSSIIVREPEAELPVLAAAEDTSSPTPAALLSTPVRAPHPVPLTRPILVVQAEARVPNVVIVRRLQ